LEVDESTGLAKYARAMSDSDADEWVMRWELANVQGEDEELEEATSAEATALLAMKTPGVSVEEMHALLVGYITDQCDDTIEFSPDPDMRRIRNAWARKGVLERVWGVLSLATNYCTHRRFGMLGPASCSCCTNTTESPCGM
jgi:hypothetical protein